MAIMTGVQSAQVLGPTTQKQAEKSKQSMQGVEEASFDASENVGEFSDNQGGSGGKAFGAQSDGGKREVEKKNGLDVIR